MLPLLAPLLLAASALAADDASALLQAAVRQEPAGAETVSMGSEAKAPPPLKPKLTPVKPTLTKAPAISGIHVKRATQVRAGGKVWFNVSNGCTDTDQFGKDNCTLHWGDSVSLGMNVELSGLKKGDKLVTDLDVVLEPQNKADQLSALVAGTLQSLHSNCTFCEGSCFSKISMGSAFVETVTPSSLVGPMVCGANGQVVANLTNYSVLSQHFQLPERDPNFKVNVKGSIVSTTRIISNGNVSLTNKLNLTLVHDRVAGLQRETSSPTRPEEGVAPTSHLVVRDQVLRQIIPAMLLEGVSERTLSGYALLKGNDTDEKDERLNSMTFQQSVSGVAAGNNFTFSMAMGGGECKNRTTNAREAFDCTFRFGKEFDVSKLDSYVAYTAEEGTYFDMTVSAKVGGFMGMMVNSFLKPQKLRVPLCGHNASVIVAGKASQIDLGPCGFFSYRMVAKPMELLMPDLGLLPIATKEMPMLPKRLSDCPPVTATADIHMRRRNGTAIFHEKITVGLDHKR